MPSSDSNDFERILLMGYDQYRPVEQLTLGFEKP